MCVMLLVFTTGVCGGFALCMGYSDQRVRRRVELLERIDPQAAAALARAYRGWEP